jgi:hypothetical protein
MSLVDWFLGFASRRPICGDTVEAIVGLPPVHRINRESEGETSGIPHLAKNERDTRISCTRHQVTAACAAFIEESRMKSINANKLHRKSGGVGHPSFVRGRGAT